MPSESDPMSTNDADAAQEPKGKEREYQEADEGEDVPVSEDHFPKQRSARDLSIRIALRHAGYDVSKLKDGAELDDAAKKLLKAKTTRTRIISRSWPRDPKGQQITFDDTLPGKTTSNGVLWGATLLDFFRVCRIPEVQNFLTLTTGSKMAAWMKKNGEEECSAEEMAWAEMEGDPREVPPCSIAILIEPMDMQIAWGGCGESMSSKNAERNEGGQTDQKKKRKKKKKAKKRTGKGKEKEKPILFDASSYPTPWPLVPFSYPAPTLQDYIPLNRLPKKLIVHDPWNLLSAKDYEPEDQSEDDSGREDNSGCEGNSEPEDRSEPEEDPAPQKKRKIGDWTKTPDITHVYELKLSPEATERLEAEAETAKEAEVHQGFFIYPDQKESGPIEPPIYVMYPPSPPSEPVEEAHLYISPAHSAGKGNHSIVYRAEWEVQRSMLMPHKICQQCVMEDVVEILKEEDGEDGSKKKACWKEKSAQLNRVPCAEPGLNLSLMKENKAFETKDGEIKPKPRDNDRDVYNIHPGRVYDKMDFEGPVRPIATRVQWVSPDALYTMPCSHGTFMTSNPHPPTTKVKVMAKLSLQNDRHLAAEARNYQQFPKHMFENWNGFNLLLPLHDPTPVSAVVPQFYGYYVPVGSEENTYQADTDTGSDVRMASPPEPKPYLSPIMLLEDCGVPLNPQDLNIDEKNECASLYYRFHRAGWTHGSIAQRNILVQRGPLSTPPFYRCIKALEEEEEEHSFRLIDFGRSAPLDELSRSMERSEVAKLFGFMGTRI